MKESVLFWPVKYKGASLEILDETRIPQKIAYLKVRGYRDAIRAVAEMKTRAFGQFLTVCYTFMMEISKIKNKPKEEQGRCLREVAEAFNKSRPTFPFEEVTGMVLGMAQKVYDSLFPPSPEKHDHEVMDGWLKTCGFGGFRRRTPRDHGCKPMGLHFADSFLNMMNDFLENGIRRQRYGRAQAAARLIQDGDAVLTHCHVSGEMALIAAFCRQDKKKVRFFVTETRPYFQGSRLTAWELKEAGCDVTIVPDNAVAKLMADGDINCVIVGSDRSAKNGDFANKVGTYQIALLARHFGIPFYALVQPSDKLATGQDIPIEIRSEEEILAFEGERLAAKGVRAFYPGFDVVERDLATQLIAIHAN